MKVPELSTEDLKRTKKELEHFDNIYFKIHGREPEPSHESYIILIAALIKKAKELDNE